MPARSLKLQIVQETFQDALALTRDIPTISAYVENSLREAAVDGGISTSEMETALSQFKRLVERWKGNLPSLTAAVDRLLIVSQFCSSCHAEISVFSLVPSRGKRKITT